jgi:hypothetical protein
MFSRRDCFAKPRNDRLFDTRTGLLKQPLRVFLNPEKLF